MATIDDLGISILDMPRDNLIELIHSLRQSRRTKKITKTTTRRVVKKAAKVDPTTLLASMTQEQRDALIKELEKTL